MALNLFPYEIRKGQDIIINEIRELLNKKEHIIIEAGTGIGKTIAVLVPSVEYAIEHQKRVLYLTRTNSQQQQVIAELKRINKIKKVFAVAFQGRSNLCLLYRDSPEHRAANAEELAKLCADRKRATLNNAECGIGPFSVNRGQSSMASLRLTTYDSQLTTLDCPYFRNMLDAPEEELKNIYEDKLPTAEEWSKICEEQIICPYETAKLMLKHATVVAAPYIFFFDKFLRQNLLNLMNCTIEDLILIIDEAHNLPDYGRNLLSYELTEYQIHMSERELEKIERPFINGFSIGEFLDFLRNVLHNYSKKYILPNQSDGIIPDTELVTDLYDYFGLTSVKMKKILTDMKILGKKIREDYRKEGKLPRSYLYSLVNFVSFYIECDAEEYIKLITTDDKHKPTLELYCMAPYLATDIVNACHSSIHISGTLTPFEEYRDSIGLPVNVKTLSIPSPFPSENKKLFYVPAVTTQYERRQTKEMFSLLKKYLIEILNSTSRNCAVFFPGFALIEQFNREDIELHVKKDLFIETRRLSQPELIEMVTSFKKSGEKGGAILFGVYGGRLSEGLDYPEKQLEIVVCLGIPYPQPTAKLAALQDYYDKKFGKGWEYVCETPALRKLKQAIGRLIRTPTDRGVAIILDERIKRFTKYFDEKIHLTEQPAREIKKFFDEI